MSKGHDLINRKFGKLIITEFSGTKKDIRNKSVRYWKYICECGNKGELSGAAMTSGNTKSCGCIHKKEDLIGRKYGKLTVVENLGARNENENKRSTFWKCQCDCGKIVEKAGRLLLSGNTKSCGCYQREFKTTHGKSRGKK